MKTFNEFLKESMGLGYQFDNAKEAERLANSWGFEGFHEVDGVYYPCLTPMEFQRMLAYIRGKKMVGACESINESVLRHKWDGVTPDDIDFYVKKNDLKLVRDYLGYYIGVKKSNPKQVIFNYDPESMTMYSDYTIIQLEDGKAK